MLPVRFEGIDVGRVDGDTRNILVPGVDAGSVRDDVRLGCRDTRFCGVDGNGAVLRYLFGLEGVDVRCVYCNSRDILIARVHSGGVGDNVRLCCRDARFCGVDGDGVVLRYLFGLEGVDVGRICRNVGGVDGDTRNILVPRVHSGSVRDDIGLCCRDARFCGVDGNGVVLNDLFRFQRIDCPLRLLRYLKYPGHPCSLRRCWR